MSQTCSCGYTLTVHTTADYFVTYCEECGAETKEPSNKPRQAVIETPIISLSRASILKKIKNKVEEEPKRPRQIRDKANYMPQRGGGRR